MFRTAQRHHSQQRHQHWGQCVQLLFPPPEGKIASYTIPSTIGSIGPGAFSACSALSGVVIPDSVTNIGFGAFSQCPGLITVALPNSVTAIGHDAFGFCQNLTSITLPDHLTSISNDMFYACGRLASISLPNSLLSIADYAFYNCTALTHVSIPDSATNIGNMVFSGCANLITVTIPAGITYVGNDEFCGCSSLTGVCFKGNAPRTGTYVFYNDYQSTVYYLPGTMGWGATFGDPFGYRPTALWNPQAQTTDASFGIRTNRFGFAVTGTSNLFVLVEACTNLNCPVWLPVGTNTLTNGVSYFSDPGWTNYPSRFYRLRSP